MGKAFEHKNMNIYDAYISTSPLYSPLLIVGLITLAISVVSFIIMFFSQSTGVTIFVQFCSYAAIASIIIAMVCKAQLSLLEPKARAAELAANNQISIEKLTIDKYLITYRILTDGKAGIERVEVPAEVIDRMKNPGKSIQLPILAEMWLASTLIPAGLLTVVLLAGSAFGVYEDWKRRKKI